MLIMGSTRGHASVSDEADEITISTSSVVFTDSWFAADEALDRVFNEPDTVDGAAA